MYDQTITQSLEYKGKTIEIVFDTDPENPREWDNLGTMICKHREYVLGDTKEKLPEVYYTVNRQGYEVENYIESWSEAEAYLRKEHDIAVMLPLYLYDHSGITMYTSGDTGYRQHEAWDSGMVGLMYVTKDKLRKEYNCKRITKATLHRAEQVLRSELETYDSYLTGQVFGYVTENDSCYGFYNEEDAIAEAKSTIDWEVNEEQKKHEEKLKKQIKARVPLQYR